jgi:HAD superfamily 5'-nucleotidase-like hydrolase
MAAATTSVIRPHRWIKHITDLLDGILLGQRPLQIPVTERVASLLTKYNNQLKQPFQRVYSPQRSRVFANNHINLSSISVIGFDLDYTLVPYTEELQHLIFTMARDLLVSSYDYPVDLKTCIFEPSFAVRGLSVDSRNGVLVKLNNLQRVRQRYSYKGKRQLTEEEMAGYYGLSRHVSADDLTTMRPLNDLFSMAEACLIADVVDVFEHRRLRKGEQYSPAAIIDDVKSVISEVHLSGLMHKAVANDFDKFVIYNPNLLELLLHFRNSGKKLFLATNSAFPYVDKALSYAMGLPTQNKTNKSEGDWKQLFDLIICSASKPDFFNSKKPFRKWNSNINRPLPSPVDDVVPGEVYVNGSVYAMKRSKNWQSTDVLYVGDNLGADLVEAKRQHGWHTAGVINELDREIEIQSSDLFNELHYLRSTLRNALTDIQLAMFSSKADDDKNTHYQPSWIDTPDSAKSDNASTRSPHPDIEAYAQHLAASKAHSKENLELISIIEDELKAINTELSLLFNQQFGSMFRTDGHTSLYAYAVRRYADLYMSHVCHFLHYSPTHRFYPPHSLHMVSFLTFGFFIFFMIFFILVGT